MRKLTAANSPWTRRMRGVITLVAVLALSTRAESAGDVQTVSPSSPIAAAEKRSDTDTVHHVESASEVLERLFANHPATWERFHELLRDAHGFAVFPGLIKAGVMLASIQGRGVLTYRDADDRWSPPILLTIQGRSLGFQAGALVSDVLIVLKTRRSLESLLSGNLKLGMDVPSPAEGLFPAADGQAEIVSYALRRGIMLGQSIDEYSVSVDDPGNLTLYGHTLRPGEIAKGVRVGLRLPAPAQKYIEQVNLMSGKPSGVIEWK